VRSFFSGLFCFWRDGHGLIRKEYHGYIYLFALFMLAVSLPLSKYFMSVAQLMLLGNWITEGRLQHKLKMFVKNRAALIFTGLYLLHLAGMLYSSDWEYGLKDIRVKLPLLALPVILASSVTIDRKLFFSLLQIHALAVLAGSFIGLYVLLHQKPSDLREVSIFISHIRFSLNACIAAVSLVYIALQHKRSLLIRLLMLGSALWLTAYMFLTESFTGVVLLLLVLLVIVLLRIFSVKRIWLKSLLVLLLILIPVSVFFYVRGIVTEVYYAPPVNIETLEWTTPSGNTYEHYPGDLQTENGNYLWMYVCYDELAQEWNKRSKIPFDSLDKSGQAVKYTLVRYMTSKGMRKDSLRMASLTNEDIGHVENGVANYRYLDKGSLRNRISGLVWEFKNYMAYGDPRGQSFMQRTELWRISVKTLCNHPLTGVGTGDVKNVFASALVVYESPLAGSGLRSHNQYLTFALAFGIPGLLLALIFIFLPFIQKRMTGKTLPLAFLIIMAASMLTEDTLESQPGVTLFAFFYCLYLFFLPAGEDKKPSEAHGG
jgi:hypothetical protein